MATTGTPQLEALERGRAFAELTGWRIVHVGGADARRWLHDLITADVAGLAPGMSRRSLVLTPTGRIRADLHVAARPVGFLLLQPPEQPDPIDRILGPYVLSSDVTLEDGTAASVGLAVLGGNAAEDGDISTFTPSVFGPGRTLVVPAGATARQLRQELVERGLAEVSDDALETWRIRQGRPRMMADFGRESLPAEAGLEDAIDFTKGCFLGQESAAKVRNLGHPPTILRAVAATTALAPGDDVYANGRPVGAIARVRWEAANDALTTGDGSPLLQQEQ
jgi:folate-binding protein YgfZ